MVLRGFLLEEGYNECSKFKQGHQESERLFVAQASPVLRRNLLREDEISSCSPAPLGLESELSDYNKYSEGALENNRGTANREEGTLNMKRAT